MTDETRKTDAYVLVPREPTPQMLDALFNAEKGGLPAAYRAMLAAASVSLPKEGEVVIDGTVEDTIRRCNAAAHDERLADGMLYRRAASLLERLWREKEAANQQRSEEGERRCATIARMNAELTSAQSTIAALRQQIAHLGSADGGTSAGGKVWDDE